MYFAIIALALAFIGGILQIVWYVPKNKVPIDKQIGRVVAVIVIVCLVIVFQVMALTCSVINGTDRFADYIMVPFAILWLGIKVLHLHLVVEAKIKGKK